MGERARGEGEEEGEGWRRGEAGIKNEPVIHVSGTARFGLGFGSLVRASPWYKAWAVPRGPGRVCAWRPVPWPTRQDTEDSTFLFYL
jgi:hypothetical protein